MTIGDFLAYLLWVMAGMSCGAALGAYWGHKAKGTGWGWFVLAASVGVGIFLAVNVGLPTLGDLYQDFEGIDFGTDDILTGFVTAFFAGWVGAALGLVVFAAIELRREAKRYC